MIDTVRLNTPIEPRDKGVGTWDVRCQTHGKAFEQFEHCIHMGVSFTVSRRSGRAPWLSAEASYPKLAYGHNVGTLDLIGASIAQPVLAEAIRTLPFSSNLPPIDEWLVSRLDLSHAWRVGDPSVLIHDLSPFVRCRTRNMEVYVSGDDGTGTTLVIDPKGRRRLLYDKGGEIRSATGGLPHDTPTARRLLEFSNGVLKFESKARRRRINAKLFPGDMRARDLETYIRTKADDDLRLDLDELLRSWSPTEDSIVIDLLQSVFRHRRAKVLFGVYTGIQAMGLEAYRRKLVTNDELLRRDLADLKLARVGFGKLAGAVRLEIPSTNTVWCRDLDLREEPVIPMAA